MPHVVNGLGELDEPSSVALVQGAVPQDGAVVCSGVLIGCDSVITTAHCFNTNTSLKTHFFIPHAGFHEIESATRHPAYVDAITNQPPGWLDTTREDDISFVKLVEPVVGVSPSTTLVGPTPGPGTPAFLVGFGRDPISEAGVQNPGLKRSGNLMLDTCQDPALQGLDLLCWTPITPLPAPGEEVSTCSGDSGGPLFTWQGGTRILSGITKGAIFDPQGQPDLCEPPVHPYDVNVQRQLAWIQSMVTSTGAQPLDQWSCSATPQLPELVSGVHASCGGPPFSGGDMGRTCGFEGTLGGAAPSGADYSFQVPDGTGVLRVALNGFASTGGSFDTDLYVRRGAPATPAQNDCAADHAGTLGFCEWDAPQPGTWYVRVEQALSEGDHQVVVTLLPEPLPPPVPGPGLGAAALLVALLGARRAPGAAQAPRLRLKGRATGSGVRLQHPPAQLDLVQAERLAALNPAHQMLRQQRAAILVAVVDGGPLEIHDAHHQRVRVPVVVADVPGQGLQVRVPQAGIDHHVGTHLAQAARAGARAPGPHHPMRHRAHGVLGVEGQVAGGVSTGGNVVLVAVRRLFAVGPLLELRCRWRARLRRLGTRRVRSLQLGGSRGRGLRRRVAPRPHDGDHQGEAGAGRRQSDGPRLHSRPRCRVRAAMAAATAPLRCRCSGRPSTRGPRAGRPGLRRCRSGPGSPPRPRRRCRRRRCS